MGCQTVMPSGGGPVTALTVQARLARRVDADLAGGAEVARLARVEGSDVDRHDVVTRAVAWVDLDEDAET